MKFILIEWKSKTAKTSIQFVNSSERDNKSFGMPWIARNVVLKSIECFDIQKETYNLSSLWKIV